MHCPLISASDQRAQRLVRALGLLIWLAVPPVAALAQVAGVVTLATAPVQAQSGADTLVLDGTLEARVDARLSAQVSGRITQVMVRAGDVVRAGQPLLRIDATLAGQQLAASRAQQAQAEAMLQAAQADVTRAQSLAAKGYISPAALDQARAQFKSAQAGAEALRAQALASGTQAGFHEVRAPYAGRVTQVMTSEGDLASPGVPLLQLFSPQGLRVAVSVPESDVAHLQREAPARFSLPHVGDQAWTVAHFTLLPGLDPVTHAAIVRLELPPAAVDAVQAVGPGQLVRVSLPLRPARRGERRLCGRRAGLAAPAPGPPGPVQRWSHRGGGRPASR
jgi:multidrug efflux system membrane fusion protein